MEFLLGVCVLGSIAFFYLFLPLAWMGGAKKSAPHEELGDSEWPVKSPQTVAVYDLFSMGVRCADEQDFQEAVRWWTMAAMQGHDISQFFLGMMYAEGQGVEKSTDEAENWYRLAAEQGLADAQCRLALLLMPNDPSNDTMEWYYWLSKAAIQNHEKAEGMLGAMYATGDLLETNRVSAYFWLERARRHGNKRAPAALNKVASRMTIGEMRQAKERVRFYPSGSKRKD